MESFYGGKQGRSYKIVQHFDSVYDMVTAFNQGGSYTDVGYDEYVIIDTIINRNAKTDLENGLLYRRGYNYSEPFNRTVLNQTKNCLDPDDYETKTNITLYTDTLNDLVEYTEDKNGDPNITSGNYSIQVGSLQVPKYKTLYYRIKDGDNGYEIEYIINPALNTKWKENWKSFVTNPGGGAEYVGQIVGPKGDNTPIKVVDPASITQTNGGQVQVTGSPGKVDNNSFNDKITYTYANLLDANGNICQTELAFDIPYTVFEFEAHGISAYPPSNLVPINGIYTDLTTGITYHYNTSTGLWEYEGLISEQSDSLSHPYYKHYDIKVPKGIHGRDVTEIGIESTNESDPNHSKRWCYETKTYDAELNPTVEHHALDPFRNIIRVDRAAAADNANNLAAGDFYVEYTDKANLERLPLAQINKITFEGDLLLIQFKDTVGEEPASSHNDKPFFNSSINQTHLYSNEYWVNLGSVARGNHVLTNFTTENELKRTYPSGLGDINLTINGSTINTAGWVTTVGTSDTGYKIYAYNYVQAAQMLQTDSSATVSDCWYQLQDMTASSINPQYSVLLETPDAENEKLPANNSALLNENGLWFVLIPDPPEEEEEEEEEEEPSP